MSELFNVKSWDELWKLILKFAASTGLKLLYAVIVFIIFYKIIHWGTRKLRKTRGFKKMNRSVAAFLISCIRVLLYGLLIFYCATVIGVPQSAFISILASVGVAAGMAMQGSLSNFAGGIMLLIFKPFTVGDFIESQGVSGSVEDINVFYTTLISLDKKRITIPNGQLTNTNIINYTALGIRRLDLTFGVSYESDIDKVKKVMLEAANSNKYAVKDPPPFAGLQSTGDNAMIFTLWVYCNASEYLDAYYSLSEQVKKNFDENDIHIPFPQLDLHLDKTESSGM